MFADRDEAARLLAKKLEHYRGKSPLIFAIPRGAVPMAKIIADALQGEIDVVLVRKLRSPYSPEFAVGSVDESGWCYVADYADREGAGPEYIEREKSAQMAILAQRRAKYTPPLNPGGRIAIVIDDGLATGSTMISALHALRSKNPSRLICAVPVAPPETLARVSELADETVCLEAPEFFQAVGQFYRHFPQVEDDEVVSILKAAHEKPLR
ncbi:MAG: phosphoribosyltransferase [Burkholderiales bacterium]|nr:phosphoribosyltransferase [Burkholderiales bacterium]